KTGSGADRFGGEERFEQTRRDLRRNADTEVYNLDDHLAIFQARADTDFPGAVDRMNRVVDEIGPDLIEFAPVSHDARQRAIEGPYHCHVLQFVTKHCQRAFEAFM